MKFHLRSLSFSGRGPSFPASPQPCPLSPQPLCLLPPSSPHPSVCRESEVSHPGLLGPGRVRPLLPHPHHVCIWGRLAGCSHGDTHMAQSRAPGSWAGGGWHVGKGLLCGRGTEPPGLPLLVGGAGAWQMGAIMLHGLPVSSCLSPAPPPPSPSAFLLCLSSLSCLRLSVCSCVSAPFLPPLRCASRVHTLQGASLWAKTLCNTHLGHPGGSRDR